MESKIKIKMGAIEVEYEGSEQFLKKELPLLLSAVSQLYAQNGHAATQPSSTSHDGGSGAEKPHSKGVLTGTTAMIAGKLGAKSGADLIYAAAVHLTLVAGKSEFPRKELLAKVKGASGYYKETYRKNFTNSLHSLRDGGKLVEPRDGVYALDASKLEELRKTLAT